MFGALLVTMLVLILLSDISHLLNDLGNVELTVVRGIFYQLDSSQGSILLF